MNVNIDNLEHVLSTLTGFESLSNGDPESPDSVYTKTVLKLNGVDFKHRAGTEGFMSSVKDGAAKVYEMIKNFIKAIRDFFKGTFGKKVDQAVSVSGPDAEKSIKIIETKIRQDVISERAKQDVQASVERIKNKIEQMKKNVVDTPTVEKKIDLIIEKKKKAPAIYKDQEVWDGGSVKVTINELLICDKAKFREAVEFIDIVSKEYGFSAMNASHEFMEIRDLYEELKVPGDADDFKFVVDNLKTAKNVLYTLNRINSAAGDSVGTLSSLLEKINEESRVDKTKTTLTPIAIQQDRSLIVALLHSMSQLKERHAKTALSISENIKKIQVLVGGEEISEQSKRIRQEAMDALAHVPE
ncbi:MAG: hypothetical protein ACRCVV_11105 [Shewanella sp.]